MSMEAFDLDFAISLAIDLHGSLLQKPKRELVSVLVIARE